MFNAQWQWMRMSVLSVAQVSAGDPLDEVQGHVDEVGRTVDGGRQKLDELDSALSGGKSSSGKQKPKRPQQSRRTRSHPLESR